MVSSSPHYLLYSESAPSERSPVQPWPTDVLRDASARRWRFVLQAVDGSQRVEADDVEPDVRGERLELLALVRGLEALDQPSRVTLLTSSRYVRLGLAYGLDEWRANGWLWERFGQLVPVKNADLWQRVDRALRFHALECRTWRVDVSPCGPSPCADASPRAGRHALRSENASHDEPSATSVRAAQGLRNRLKHALARCRWAWSAMAAPS